MQLRLQLLMLPHCSEALLLLLRRALAPFSTDGHTYYTRVLSACGGRRPRAADVRCRVRNAPRGAFSSGGSSSRSSDRSAFLAWAGL